jgi:phosphotransferase system IIB component
MRIGKLAGKAKDMVDKRGGTDNLKADAQELKEIAGGKGSLKEKAKAAGQAIKNPGAEEQPAAEQRAQRPAAPAQPETPPEGGAAPPKQ